MPVEIERQVSSGAGYTGQPQGVGLDTAGDRVPVTTFPYAMPNNVYTLNSPGSAATQQLVEDIMSLPLLQTSIPPQSRNVKEPVVAPIRELKVMPSDPTRYSRADSSVHLFLLTFSSRSWSYRPTTGGVHGNDADSPRWYWTCVLAQERDGSWGWCVPVSTSLPQPNSKHSRSELMPSHLV